MKETTIKKLSDTKLNKPVLIEGLPGLGLVGRIVIRYLAKNLVTEKIAYLYSPHFPYFVLVGKRGGIRLLRGTFYSSKTKNGKNDLMLFTGDSQAQTIEGQYEISESILNFAKDYGVDTIVTVGGYRVDSKDTPRVMVAATTQSLLKKALDAGATMSPVGSPIVGTAGLILGLGHFKNVSGLCLLSETRGYLPDPKAAKSVLEVLNKMLGINLDLKPLDEEIAKADKMVSRLEKIEEKRALEAEEVRKEQDRKVTYIS